MPLCQEESWAGPKIQRHKHSTGNTAHICPLLRKLRVEERGISWFIWNAFIVKEFIIFSSVMHILLLPAPPSPPSSPAKAYFPIRQVFKTVLQVWGGIKKTSVAGFILLALPLSVIMESSILQAWLSANNLQFVNGLHECTCFYLYPYYQSLCFIGLISLTSF